jgi:C-terminal processing protease CtpA/Prc
VVDGTRVEGRGVVPDELIPVSVESLRAGSDAPLEAARRWILSTH